MPTLDIKIKCFKTSNIRRKDYFKHQIYRKFVFKSCRLESNQERFNPLGIDIEDNLDQLHIDTGYFYYFVYNPNLIKQFLKITIYDLNTILLFN